MDKLLIRILIGLVVVVTTLGLFSFTTLKVSNQVRLEHYWSDVLTKPMDYLAREYVHGKRSLPAGVFILPHNHNQYSGAFNTRINAGQTVFDIVDGRYRAWKAKDDNLLFVLDSDPSGLAFYEFYLSLIKLALDDIESETKIPELLDHLSLRLEVGIIKLQSADALQSQVILDSLVETGRYLVLEDNQTYGLLRGNNGQIYRIELPEPLSAYSWTVIVFLLAVIVMAIAFSGYFLIKRFDQRLRNIETVASRIARGELDARVKRVEDNDSISRLGSAFNAMADHIQRLMYVQKEMIHAVSHELRTPVARIRFGVQMIEDCPSEEALKKQISGIDGDIQELDELIDEILTYARLEQGGPILAFQEADVCGIVDQVISEQSSVKPEMKIFAEYKPGSDLWKLSDVEARYIHRSIQNLVGNATRYADSTVKVVCSFDKDTCRVDVEDDGPGIPEDQWESVFTPFARLDDSRTRSSGGYGLGLSIVRRILYWHGGQAFLGRSADLGGAKFSLVWPRKQVA